MDNGLSRSKSTHLNWLMALFGSTTPLTSLSDRITYSIQIDVDNR